MSMSVTQQTNGESSNSIVKFHYWLQLDANQHETTLKDLPLRFFTNGGCIISPNGLEFQHPLKNDIWNLLKHCKKVGDGRETSLVIPFRGENYGWDLEGTMDLSSHDVLSRGITYGWNSEVAASQEVHLSVRVFGLDSLWVDDAAENLDNLLAAEKACNYWMEVKRGISPNPVLCEKFEERWKNPAVDMKLAEARQKVAEAHINCMRPTPS